MTNEQYDIIDKVVRRIASKYVFGPYDYEDVCQTAWEFALMALAKWDGTRPLENFMAVVLPNKLKNFKRNKYYRLGVGEKYADTNESKRKLMEMAEYFDSEEDKDYLEKLNEADAVRRVLAKLSPSIRADFLRLANGVCLSKLRRDKVYNQVREILKDF